MKIKSVSFLSGMFVLFILTSGFVKPDPMPSSENLKGGKISFAEFLSHFDKVETPFEVTLSNRHLYENKKVTKAVLRKNSKSKASKNETNRYLMKDYIPELKNGMFSRSGPPEVVPVARFYPNNKMIAVVYMTYHPFRNERMSSYSMVLFDLKGKRIYTEDIETEEGEWELDYGFNLAYNSYGKTETFSIDEKGQIVRKTYDNLWKDDINKKGYKDNEIIGFDLKDTKVFAIQSNGLVEESKSHDVDTRASLD